MTVEEAFATNRDYLWGMLYRMTGVRADADDLLQETFLRALASPPADTSRPWRPWLARVAVNLGRDALRRRRRMTYVGPWLPSPVPTSELPPTPEARYGNRESASMAFLRALEVLTPNQRAVLILRDVLDHSVRETSELLDITTSNVKVTLHRARKAMESYETKKFTIDPDVVGPVFQEFFAALSAGDSERVIACLADDAVAISDSGGKFTAARRVVVGAQRVQALLEGLARHVSGEPQFDLVSLNGLPAIDAHFQSALPSAAPRVIFGIDVRDDGKIDAVWLIAAPRKLAP